MSDFLLQKPIILASGSPSRKALMQTLGIDFKIVQSHCDEEAIKQQFHSSSLIELARTLAAEKALTVSRLYPQHVVIAADQLCVIDNKYLDKPGSHTTATTHLRLLSGRVHQQIAACCIAEKGQIIRQFDDSAFLTMHELNDTLIESYLQQDKPYYSCGAYHFEGRAKWLFKAVNGHEDTILGLPLVLLVNHLLDLGAVSLTC